jgi:hypothetical protein
VIVAEGALTDHLTISGTGYKPGLAFELFTVQRSFLTSTGSIDPNFTTFGLAWYQTELQANSNGQIFGTLHTTLINTTSHPGVNVRDQIFGSDPDVKLPPTNTFLVGFWFNDPTDASACGFTGFTPFNGENHAGPLAMIRTELDYWFWPAMLESKFLYPSCELQSLKGLSILQACEKLRSLRSNRAPVRRVVLTI